MYFDDQSCYRSRYEMADWCMWFRICWSDLYEAYFELHPEKRDEFPNPLTFYPDINVQTPELIEYRDRSVKWMYYLYFSSIFKHGAAMFLGAVLAINVIQRDKDKDNTKKYQFITQFIKNYDWMCCILYHHGFENGY